MITTENNPFIRPGKTSGATDAESRLHMVREFSPDECARALCVPGLQKTVERAIRVRIRKLERDAWS